MMLLRVKKWLFLGKHEQCGCCMSAMVMQKGTRSSHGGLSVVVGTKLLFLTAVRQDPQAKPKPTTCYSGGMFTD